MEIKKEKLFNTRTPRNMPPKRERSTLLE